MSVHPFTRILHPKMYQGAAFGLIVILFIASASPATSQTDDVKSEMDSPDVLEQRQHAIRQLSEIKSSLKQKQRNLEDLKKHLEQSAEADEEEIRNRLVQLHSEIDDLSLSFEQIVIGGIDTKLLADEIAEEFDWREELILITKPVLSSLKDLTEKPRRIEELRSAIARHELQLNVVRRALASIVLFEQNELPPHVAEEIGAVAESWRQRKHAIERSQEVTKLQLDNLERDDTPVIEGLHDVFKNFVLGRGLTLLLAIAVGVIVWMAMNGLRRLFGIRNRGDHRRKHPVRIRVILYTYHLITALFITLAILSVFYVREDLLLLALTLIALAVLALGARQFIPQYVSESRLLLNVGPVREGERIVYKGVPLLVEHLNVYTELRNPELEGTVRLPLGALEQLVSRPCSDESWFPCSVGDFVKLADGGTAEILRQTVEFVQFRRRASIVQVATADFIGMGVSNLSREGFGVASTFGIDYQHQGIALSQVPKRFEEAVRKRLKDAELWNDADDLLVDFKEAGASSLDFLIYVTMSGRAAAHYFAVPRLVQQACVGACNKEGWGIPFTQVTIHNAEQNMVPDKA